ncbi:unnamed protein product [Linum tenue]|uniref:Uncharacterized protein n=1 Tax=Linum tenue TaxID=586396 RepID=A0AAV0R9W3_9ROSI|nr:unnamed protein product [Linum tenue]
MPTARPVRGSGCLREQSVRRVPDSDRAAGGVELRLQGAEAERLRREGKICRDEGDRSFCGEVYQRKWAGEAAVVRRQVYQGLQVYGILLPHGFVPVLDCGGAEDDDQSRQLDSFGLYQDAGVVKKLIYFYPLGFYLCFDDLIACVPELE